VRAPTGAGALFAAGLLVLWPVADRPLAAQEVDAVTVPSDQTVILERADRARVKGSEAAPIRIVEVSDFECPYCAQFYGESYRTIDSLYVRSGLVRYVWISFPNANHPRSWPAIEAAFCAGAAGRFWPMHDLLFERQQEWKSASDPNELFRSWAADIGIDEASFADCLRNDQTAPLQVRDYESAIAAGVTSTPFFIVGDSLAIRGAVPLETFRSAVDSVLAIRGHPTPGSQGS